MSVTTTKPRRLLCRAWEVRAYLSGAKTQFRVPIKPQPTYMDGRWWKFNGGGYSTLDYVSRETATGIETESTPDLPELIQKLWKCPFGPIGSRMWLAEAFAYCVLTSDMTYECHSVSIPKEWYKPPKNGALNSYHIAFKADDDDEPIVGPWRSASVMPQWASRLTLQVKSVRVQRLQDISEQDAIAEGVAMLATLKKSGFKVGAFFGVEGVTDTDWLDPRDAYEQLWDLIHGPGSWESNPWVWAVEAVIA